ncbi:MAG: hypothetical protein ACW98D_13320 [Promethearchaeota archaeon]|jgi:hypothetical protein
MKNISIENTVKFQDLEELYFPKNCVVCNDETENRIAKSEYGSFTSIKDYKTNYKFELPLCEMCNSNINLKAGLTGIILFLSVILGIGLGIMVYYFTYSIILSVAIFIVLFVFPYIKYRAKIKPRIKLSDYLQMKVIPNEELIQFKFFNKNYADYVNKINSEKIEAKRIETEKIKAEKLEAERIRTEKLEAERIEAEKIKAEKLEAERIRTEKLEAERIEAEKIKEKEKSETDNITTHPAIPLTKETSKITELTKIPAIKEDHTEAKKCPKCGSTLKPNWKFCVFCSEVIRD